MIDIPFTFYYYGIPYTQLRVSTDGWLAFGSGTQTAPVNTGLPNADIVNSMAFFVFHHFSSHALRSDLEYTLSRIY